MHNLTFLEPRRGLETRLRQAWEEFFNLAEFIISNHKNLNLNLANALDHIAIEKPTEALNDPRYEKYFKEATNPEKPCLPCLQYIDIYEGEFGQLDWEAPICLEAWNWLWFIAYTAVLVRLDGLYLTGTIIERKTKKGKKRYFYLKWSGILYGENIRTEEFEIIKLAPNGEPIDKEPRKWKFDRKTLSLGYIPIQLDEKIARKIKTGKSLEWYLDKVINDEKIKKARLVRNLFYLLKTRWKEIKVLEHLYPLLRTKRKKLPYPRWLDDERFLSLAINIISLKRLLYPELEEKHGKWFEFWEVFC